MKSMKKLVIMVRLVEVDDQYEIRIFQPEGGAWADVYSVIENPAKKPVVFVRFKHRRPVILRFECINDTITGIGFSESETIQEHKKKGRCGCKCFVLRTDLRDPQGKKVVEVKNLGHRRKDGYHFKFWLGSGLGPPTFDPQIYNEGNPNIGDDGWLVRLLRRLWRWLTPWFR